MTDEPPVEKTDLSQMQRLLWTGNQVFGQNPVYNTAWRFDFDTHLDAVRFAQAFHDVARKTDALRCVIHADGPLPQLQVLPALAGTFEHITLPTPEVLDQWIAARVSRLFDLSKASVDCVLIDTPAGSTWFLNTHHIVNDGASGPILFKAVAAAYSSDAELPDVPSFAAHVAREADRLLPDDVAFWDDWQKQAPPLPKLYGAALSGQTVEAVEKRVALSPAQLDGLQALSKRDGYATLNPNQSLFLALQTTVFAWMSRIAAQERLSLGIVTHGRNTPKARMIPGCFIDIFPLDLDVAPGGSFGDVYQGLRSRNLELLRHASPGAYKPDGRAQFSVILNVFQARFGDFDGHQVRATWLGNGHTDATHALRLNVIDGGPDDIVLKFLFNRDVVDGARADQAVGEVLRLLDAFLGNPDDIIGKVAIAQPDAVAVALHRASFAPPVPLPDLCALFDRHAKDDADAICVIDDSRRWTRAEIGAKANAIAARLKENGVQPGGRVGLHLDRSGDLVASLLAILTCGASFVPLDPGQPEGRRDAIAAQAQLHAILSAPDCAKPWAIDCPVIDVTTIADAEAKVTAPSDATLAYILFTSGSTGTPKGVEVSRAALTQYALWAQETFAGQPGATWALHSAIGFDLTLTSIFAPLLTGGVIRAYASDGPGPDLAVLRVFEDDAVDVVKLTPGQLSLALQNGRGAKQLRALVLGGEALSTALARRAQDVLGAHIVIHNEYGPTEAVVGAMDHRFDRARDRDATVPIGRGAKDTRISVLDAGLNPVPNHVMGEIYIAGHNRLAEGYFEDVAKTRAVFLCDETAPGGRMYRTGDLASVRGDGTILYQGRADQQLKVAGIRMESAEITAAMLRQAGITDCAVIPTNAAARVEKSCTKCGITTAVPDISVTESGLCNLCVDFARYQTVAAAYFRDWDDLNAEIAKNAAAKTSVYDCIVLLSGGKDSTYALCRMAEITPRILCLTLDNGYISQEAKENILRVTKRLGLDHQFLSTPAMNDIFVDSLKRHANVCQGCFKTIYTLALQVARDHGIPQIVTGLSRGQLFETRLAPELFNTSDASVDAIDDMVLAARRTYHAYPDAVSKRLNGDLFSQGDILSDVKFIDFYRYLDVPVSEVYRYLYDTVDWVRPSDTGRSSNCLINDAGIHIHKTWRKHHNYALPYSWDVRMGHKSLREAVDELNDEIDIARVDTILHDIGFDAEPPTQNGNGLAAFYVGMPQDAGALRRALARDLPREAIPQYLLHVDALPLTNNGKLDVAALPDPIAAAPLELREIKEPDTQDEAKLLAIWRRVLKRDDIGVGDNFYDVGGSSIGAIQIAAKAVDAGFQMAPVDIFQAQRVDVLAANAVKAAPKASLAKATLAAGDLAKLAGLLGKKPNE